MITIRAATISEIKNRVDDKSRDRVYEHGCRSSAQQNNPIDGFFTFHTDCQKSGNTYEQIVQFLEWNTVVPVEEVDPNTPLITMLQTYPDIMGLDVQVDCSCPAFAYWGHRYNLDQGNPSSSVYPKEPYTVNHPDARYSCKHLATVYNTFFY